MATNMSDWFYWASLITVLTTFTAWLLFGRLTMARIERDLKREGLERPCPWDGPGARIVWYAWAIAVPVGKLNRSDDPLINVPLVRDRAKGLDKVLAFVMLVSSALMIFLILVGI